MLQKAIVVTNPGINVQIEIKQVPIPTPGPDDLLVRLSHTGVW